MAHPTDCTSCPHCNPEMAAIMRDSIAGRHESLTRRMDAITERTLRALGAKDTHPAFRALRLRALKSPSTQDLVSALATFKAERQQRNTATTSRLVTLLSAARSAPSAA